MRDRFGRPVAVVAVNREVDPSTAVRRELDDADRTTATEVVAGIEAGEFAVRYRPVVRLADESLIGLEASVHWDHPRRGTLGPDAFLPIAERHGLMGSLGDLVFGEVCAQWARWSAAGHDLTISTGISGAQLADEHLPARWGTIVRAAGLPPGSLWLQVTETSLVLGLDRAADVLRRMSEVGACIAIDDFGTGWASLTYLRNLPIQALAIDRTFVAGLDADASGGDVAVHRRAKDRAIVSSIIALALELGLGVVAEGVDRQGQRNQLLDLGCTSGQGSLFGRPVAADDVDLTVPTVPLVHRGDGGPAGRRPHGSARVRLDLLGAHRATSIVAARQGIVQLLDEQVRREGAGEHGVGALLPGDSGVGRTGAEHHRPHVDAALGAAGAQRSAARRCPDPGRAPPHRPAR